MIDKIAVGSTIVGATGRKLIVDRVDGDTIYSGELKIKISAVAEVIPPALAAGQQVKFIGDDVLYFELDEGEILEVVEDFGEWVKTRTAKRKPVSVLRSDLEVVGEETIDRESQSYDYSHLAPVIP